MNYTIHQLQVFLKVCDTNSVTKAAEHLHLTQPAVSIQLKNFQNQFEIPLTEVVGRKIFITDFGKQVAKAATAIISEIENIETITKLYQGELTGKLKLSIVSTAKYVMPYFLSGFLQKNASVELQVDVTNKAGVIESLEMNQIDFAMVSVLPDKLQVERIELMSNKLFLVANTLQKFKGKMYDKLIFESLPLIYREPGSGTRQTMERFILKNKLPVKMKMELTSNEAVKQAVLAGLGVSIMPLIGIKNELNNGDLQIIPVKGFPIKSNWHLIWLKGKKFSPVAEAYFNYIKKEKENIIKERFDWFEKY
ncbi:MAG TPA: LysR family transcriptional regulator [Chitinophagales bacterium]|nr:LysR family transcriptional regulator [Chitinophagales bacterium]